LRSYIQALGELGGAEAIAALREQLSKHFDAPEGSAGHLAIPTIITALAKALDPELPAILKTYLASHDGAVLRAALEAYRPDPKEKRPWEILLQAYSGISGMDEVETKVAVLNRLEPWIQMPEVISALKGILRDRNRNACITAAGLLRKGGNPESSNQQCRSEARLPKNSYEMIAGARQDRSVAILETSRGRIEIELFREDAPMTVANFESLARKHYFDNLQFMRVVPFFVVQAGDRRNDQEGGPGYSIRCEINRRPFESGSVGMALAGKDTGGSQFFITISPQPHLDGGFTCFGRVISGMQVVGRLVPGDRIQKVTIEEDRASLDYHRY
jgi:cyclophilin family peptidyl-prolyl cis-trans isomerase